MRLVVIVGSKEKHGLLIHLGTKKLVDNIKKLVQLGKRTRAIETAISRGKLLKTLSKEEVLLERGNLILTEEGAYWDLLP